MQIVIQLTCGWVKERSLFPSRDFGLKHDAMLRICAFPFIFRAGLRVVHLTTAMKGTPQQQYIILSPQCATTIYKPRQQVQG
jgi:hypothetical protein